MERRIESLVADTLLRERDVDGDGKEVRKVSQGVKLSDVV